MLRYAEDLARQYKAVTTSVLLALSLSITSTSLVCYADSASTSGAQSSDAAGSTTTATARTPLQGQVMKTLASLRFADEERQQITDVINQLSKSIESGMVQVSYPAIIPGISDNPITLATPDPKVMTGHFLEAHTKSTKAAVQYLSEELKLFDKYSKAIYVPEEKQAAVQPLVNDINNTMAYINSEFAIVQSQAERPGKDMDAEVVWVKLANIDNSLVTVEYDLKTIFQIVDLKKPQQDMVDQLVALRLLLRDSHWLKTSARHLGQSAKQLSPDALMLDDAINQGWLVFGGPQGGFKGLNLKEPYAPLTHTMIDKRMKEITEYTTAVKQCMDAFDIPPQYAEEFKPMVSGVQNALTSIEGARTTLLTEMTSKSPDRDKIEAATDLISQQAHLIGILGNQMTSRLLTGNTIMFNA